MRPFACVAAIAVVLLLASAACPAVDDVLDATARVSASDGTGTGTVFSIESDRVLLLTCYHVVGTASQVKCEFWRGGWESPGLPGNVQWRNQSLDMAIVAVPRSAFPGALPTAIPIDPSGSPPPVGSTLVSVGCANGSWPTGWKGRVLGYRGNDMVFTPAPHNGRSGSAICNADGTAIVGVLRARTLPEGGDGIATAIAAVPTAINAQCGPNGCPAPDRSGIRLDIGRQWQQQQPAPQTQPQTPPWGDGWRPATPSGGTVDLGPVIERLDRIQWTIDQQQYVDPTPILPPDPQGPSKLDIKDAVKEAIGGGGEGLTIGKLVAGALGFSGPLGIAILIAVTIVAKVIKKDFRDKRETGDPLIIEKLFARISDRVDSVRDRIDAVKDKMDRTPPGGPGS